MGMKTRSWDEIVAHYDRAPDSIGLRSLRALADQIRKTGLSHGLCAWTSMWDLCIVQLEVEHPYEGPFLRVKPVGSGKLEFRYIDSIDFEKHWVRTVPAEDAWDRLLSFLDQLHWFLDLDTQVAPREPLWKPR